MGKIIILISYIKNIWRALTAKQFENSSRAWWCTHESQHPGSGDR
jgi:hypothetical protein